MTQIPPPEKQRPGRRRIWVVVNLVVLAAISGWVLHATLPKPPSVSSIVAGDDDRAGGSSSGRRPVPTLTRDTILNTRGQRFGISYEKAPYGAPDLAAITKKAGGAPTMIEYFDKWTDEFKPSEPDAAYKAGALPVLSWEPWAEPDTYGVDQANFSLKRIASGALDPYITRYATGVRDFRLPIVLRFAHEMNGNWYAWSESRSGNNYGDYIKAWRHVHDVFARVGATNTIWVWSPNIIRPVPQVKLKPLYPGDAYVDWIGMVGYAVPESTAAAVFEPTMERVRTFTRKPFLITETGAQPSDHQAAWTKDLFVWLKTQPDVVGFIWFEVDKSNATADWRFTRDPQTLAAFRAGLASSRFLPPVKA